MASTTDSSARSMHQLRIAILGAGISGLSLARTLAVHSIPFIMYDKSPAPAITPRHSYGLTLQRSSTYNKLRSLLCDQGDNFDSLLVGGLACPSSSINPAGTVRLNRARLETQLSQNLNIIWDTKVASITTNDSSRPVEINFQDGTSTIADLVIDAQGIHSSVRKTLFPETAAEVLPWVVFRGKRRLTRKEWDAVSSAGNEGTVFVAPLGQRLEIKLDDVKSEDELDVSYTYSRAAQINCSNRDPLHNPSRNLEDAKIIPAELFNELGHLEDLPPALAAFYAPEKVQQDQLLHWLMRVQPSLPKNELRDLARKGVMFIGDSARAQPILSGHGANTAVSDGKELGELISEVLRDGNFYENFGSFYNSEYWKENDDVHRGESQRVLEDMHCLLESEKPFQRVA